MNDKPKWDVLSLKNDIEERFGRQQRDALESSLKGIQQRQGFVKFHFLESSKMVRDLAGEGDTGTNLILRMLEAAGTGSTGDFHQRQLEAAAHAHAALQNVHTLADLLAHVIYFALGMNLRADCTLNPTAIRMETVHKKLRNVDGTTRIELLLTEFVYGEDFAYLGHVVNQSKHCAIVEAQIIADLTGAEQHGIVLKDFERSGKLHRKRRYEDFIKAEFDRQSRLIVLIGLAINEWVGARPKEG